MKFYVSYIGYARYGYDEALSFIKSRKTIEIAVADAVDYVISQGLADVQE